MLSLLSVNCTFHMCFLLFQALSTFSWCIYAFVEALFRTEEGIAYMIVKMAGKGG